MADQLAITQHVARYAHSVDSGDGPTVAALYMDEGVFDMGHTVLVGRDQIAEYARTVPTLVPSARHAIVNLCIDTAADRQAVARAYLLLFARNRDTGRSDLRLVGDYTFSLSQMDDGRWLFSRVAFRALKLGTEA